MRIYVASLLSAFIVLVSNAQCNAVLSGTAQPTQEATQNPSPSFEAFTGRVIKNKVRLRQQPNLDSPVIRELKQGDMLVIVGESDDFYAVQPPSDVKGYVFRTYILDNVVEANRVNVRIAPEVDAAVIGQLSTGDRVEGMISPSNNKWLEIVPPSSSRFYIAKEYIQKMGNASFLVTFEKRRDEVNRLLSSNYAVGQAELQKSFPDINLNGVYDNYNKVINEYADFPEQVAKAREMITVFQDNYLQKKLSYLETKSNMVHSDWQSKNAELNQQVKNQQQKLAQLEQELQKNQGVIRSTIDNKGLSNKMAAWAPTEQNLYQAWIKQNNHGSIDDFYHDQAEKAVVLTGIVEPYIRVIKNKPGDYMLVDPTTNQPIAYLYSTRFDLQEKVGQTVTLKGAPRANNNFAFPAYFVLSVE